MKTQSNNFIRGALLVSLMLGFAGPIAAHAAGPSAVDLLSAGNFVVLGKTAVTNTGSSVITGDIGISPAAASFITGFALTADPSNTFSTSALVTGRIYAANYAPPTPAYMTTAISDMEAAYVDAAGRAGPTATNVAAGIIGGQTFVPGLYKWTTDVSIAASGATSTDVTLSGGANDVWIFQIDGDLNVAAAGSIPLGAKIVLAGGAQAKNVFWQVAGGTGATLGTYFTFKGTILTAKQVIMNTGAVLDGRALAQTQVTLQSNTIATTGVAPATLHVIKLVVNVDRGTSVRADFSVHVKNASGTDVSGSPLPGTAAPGTPYTLAAGAYTISETASASYAQSFSGTGCDSTGHVTLAAGDDKTCTIINTDILPAQLSVGTGGSVARIVPLIGILKVPSQLTLSTGTGLVAYNYTVWNVGGQQALVNVTVADDKCSPVTLSSGDLNNNSKLDPGENWKYICTMTLASTTTNTAIATGYSDDVFHQAAIATAIATVAVGVPVAPPLINLVKVPSQLTPFPVGGGDVTYTYTATNPGVVAMHDVTVVDDKCGPVTRISGDGNSNNLLDSGESWIYTCRTHISASTMNTATAEGKANGFTALGYAFATVLVAVPGLPNTGFPPAPWSAFMLVGIFAIAIVILSAIRNRQKTV